MHREELDGTESCAACGEAVASGAERGFSFGLRNLLCFDCAVRRGGRYDAERDTWTESPDVSGFADEAYGDVDEKAGA